MLIQLPSPGRVASRHHDLRIPQDTFNDPSFTLTVPVSIVISGKSSMWTAITYSFLNALTSSHIFFRSVPRGDFPFTPFPFPESIPRAVSSSAFTSFASAALRNPLTRRHSRVNRLSLTSSDLPAFISNVESSTPSFDITRAGWPTLVTFS